MKGMKIGKEWGEGEEEAEGFSRREGSGDRSVTIAAALCLIMCQLRKAQMILAEIPIRSLRIKGLASPGPSDRVGPNCGESPD